MRNDKDRNSISIDDLASFLQDMRIPDEIDDEIIKQLMIASRVQNNRDLNMIQTISQQLNVRGQYFRDCSLEIILSISFLESCKLYMVAGDTGLIDALKKSIYVV